MRPPAANSTSRDASLRVLIVCKHASARYGGEAILPLHYFRLLRDRGIDVWLITHARTRDELTALFPDETRIHYVEDTALHKLLWRMGLSLPTEVATLTTGLVSHLVAQVAQRELVKRLVRCERINLVHQPMPVSPREPSMLYDVGAPVVIGPMNGGMDYPPSFRRRRRWIEKAMVLLARKSSLLLNHLMPGKRDAALLLVANRRTQRALPHKLNPRVRELVENGVQLDLWHPAPPSAPVVDAQGRPVTTFAFVGRLLSLKAVDLLLEAFAAAARQRPMRLLVIGDGEERARLEQQAARLFPTDESAGANWQVKFTGWLPQADCARELAAVDCLAMPSLRDCGGAVVLEAMAMAKPVIATAWGGPLDYLDPSCGILVQPHSRESVIREFTDGMVRLAASPAEREAMGRAGRTKVELHYDWDVKASQILAIYEEFAAIPEPSFAPVVVQP